MEVLTCLQLQDGDIINIDVTVYLNVRRSALVSLLHTWYVRKILLYV